MGRGPKATISFTYWKARAESNAGGGPLSGGRESLGRALSAGAVAAGSCALAELAFLSWSQLTRAAASARHKIGRETSLLIKNNPRHECRNQLILTPKGTWILRCLFFPPRPALLGMDDPRNANADPVQRDHGGGKDAHAQNVGSRCH